MGRPLFFLFDLDHPCAATVSQPSLASTNLAFSSFGFLRPTTMLGGHGLDLPVTAFGLNPSVSGGVASLSTYTGYSHGCHSDRSSISSLSSFYSPICSRPCSPSPCMPPSAHQDLALMAPQHPHHHRGTDQQGFVVSELAQSAASLVIYFWRGRFIVKSGG